MEILNNILNAISGHSEWILAGGGLTLIAGLESLIMTPITRRWGEKRTQLFKMMSVVAFMGVTSALAYLAVAPELHPVVVPFAAAARFVIAQPWYLKLWEPLAKRASEYIAKAAAFDEQLRASQEPIAATVSAEPADFSN